MHDNPHCSSVLYQDKCDDWEACLGGFTTVLPLTAGLPGDNSLTNLQWSERATAVMSFLVLLAGALGGVQCLTHMNFKRDTLLFGSAKSD